MERKNVWNLEFPELLEYAEEVYNEYHKKTPSEAKYTLAWSINAILKHSLKEA